MSREIYDQSSFLIAQAAYLYYILEIPERQVAHRLGVSVSTVSRLLKRAKESGVVNISMEPSCIRQMELREELIAAFGLSDVLIAPVEHACSDEEIKKLTALEGARYIQRIIREDDVLGVAWGGTMFHLVNYLNPSRKVNSRFVTLHGSIYSLEYELDAQTLVARMAKAFSGKRYGMLVSGLVSNRNAARVIRREKNVREVFDMYDKITISLSGIGSFYPEITTPLGRITYLCDEELACLKERGVYGDLMLRFFDATGQECDTTLKDRTLAIDFDVYRKIPNKVVVASGAHKADTIRAAVKGALVDTLIVDSLLAEALHAHTS